MKLHNLKPAEGSTKNRKRIGRGQGSGRGGTSTKGHKGQTSRSGASIPAGFEGGQMPLARRIPKFGFNSPNRVSYKPVNLDRLVETLDAKGVDLSETITPETLVAAGIVGKKDLVKILGGGDVSKALKLSVHKVSAAAKEKIEKAGGTVEIIE